MSQYLNQPESEKLPSELKAVLMIFNADEELKRKALPFVNIKKREIDWYGISKNHFGSGHSAAIAWAKAIWMDKTQKDFDPFERAFSMENSIKQIVIQALKVRWNLE